MTTPQYSLLTYPHPSLLTSCDPITGELTEEDRYAIQEMKRICKESNGFALAANQIGYMRRVVVFAPYKERTDWVVMINPIWTTSGVYGEPDSFPEGCLSFPTIRQKTQRWDSVQVTYIDDANHFIVRQHFDGIVAIAIQHECEHLDGKTFIDGLSKLKQNRIKEKMKKMKV